jgi:pseudouridine kinase
MAMSIQATPPGPPFVLVLGGANMDMVASASHGLVAGESVPGRIRSAPGGVARNIAENLARLGLPTRLVTAVGDDLLGRSLLEATQRAGVDTGGCLLLAGQGSASYLSLHGPDGELAMAVNDMDILLALTPERLQPHAPSLRRAAALVLDCNLSPDALAWVFAQGSAAPVFVDAVSAFKAVRIRPWLDRLFLLKVNRLEAQALSGLKVETLADARAAAGWFIDRGVRQVGLSMGEQGNCWMDASGASGLQPVLPVQVVNATGAGDALLAGLVFAHLMGETLAQAMRFAGGCAALTLTTMAANHPGLSVARVRELLAAQSQP